MNKKGWYYYVGALLILLGCVAYYVLGLGFEWIIAIAGIILVLLSDKKWWLKALTILLLPPIAVFGFVILLFACSNEAL